MQSSTALERDGIAVRRPPLGIMVEVPAAALRAEDFGAAFYSIGSNDLTQYTMAAARDIGAVADLNDTAQSGGAGADRPDRRGGTQARRRGLALRRRRRRYPPDDGAACDRADDRFRWRRLRVGAAQGGDRKGAFMTDDAGEGTRGPGDSNVAEYKLILRRVLDNRPSGTRLKLAAALGKNRSFVTQITNPAYPVPIPAKHVVDHLRSLPSVRRRARGVPRSLWTRASRTAARAAPRGAHAQPSRSTVPDLGDDKKNRALEKLVVDFAARLARYAESVG